ncbi:MAG TPA: copper resistance CopC family protein [Mycobacteriales bacterium]|nr:copper resistance CopC family protein [Mycobacteriales bacterium]
MTRVGRIARSALAVGGALFSVVLTAGPAQAHARVIRTTPANGATIGGRISVVSVVFDDPVRLVPRSLVVSGATGAPEPIGAPRVVGGKTLEASVPGRLPAGRYFVGWRILSDDGHVESGVFGFAVGAPGSTGAALTGFASALPAPAQPTWPVIVAAVMAGVAVLGAALVAVRGLGAVRALATDPYRAEPVDTGSARAHVLMRH